MQPAGPSAVPIQPVGEDGPSRWWVVVVASGVAGVCLMAAVFTTASARLPAQIPSHYSAGGQPNSYLPPGLFTELGLALEGLVTAVMSAMSFVIGRSPVLRHHYGGSLGPVLATVGLATSWIIPLAWTSILLGAAGEWPAPLSPPLVGLLATVAIVAVTLAMLIRYRVPFWMTSRYQPKDEPGLSAADRTSGTGRLVFRCSSCGQTFHRPAIYMLGPRIVRSYYLKCPLCGETGWDYLVGTSGGTDAASDAPSPRANGTRLG
ncbi:MAG TPA: hypothetical protein VFF67_03610 [Thermoplasmata archaeon]|nr:hypothetical protein [Thermoplasmata archaeon]